MIENGWAFTNSISSADLIVISSCGAIRKNEQLSLTAIRNITENKSDSAKVIITGCLPIINPEKIQGFDDLEMIPTGELDKFDTLLGSSINFSDIPDANLVAEEFKDYMLAYRLFRNDYSRGFRVYSRFSTNRTFLRLCIWGSDLINLALSKLGLASRQKIEPYFNIRIANGCAFACTFCAIKLATGRVRSKSVDEILNEFKSGLRAGHKIFQLVCEDTGSYGLDIGTTFPELLRRILDIDGEYEIIIIDFGGYWFVKYYDDLLPLFVNHGNKIREIYVSLQSGSNKILKAMNRPDKIEEVVAKLKDVKENVPKLNLRTTVMVGFPGETEEDLLKTIAALKTIDVSEVQINKYEDRPGTISSQMSDKVPQEVIDRRYAEIKQSLGFRTRWTNWGFGRKATPGLKMSVNELEK
jgi:tRNA A37 methylthiotransferase MiaB